MGMFDWLKVELDVPELEEQLPGYKDMQFQTKSFENMLWHYKITADGTIIEHWDDHDWDPNAESGFYKMGFTDQKGAFVKCAEGDRPRGFHGIVSFHTGTDNGFVTISFLFEHDKFVKLFSFQRG